MTNPETNSEAPASVPATPRSISEYPISAFYSGSAWSLADEVAIAFEVTVNRLAPHLDTAAVEHAVTILREVLEERIDSLIDAHVFDAIEELVAVEVAADEAGEDAAA